MAYDFNHVYADRATVDSGWKMDDMIVYEPLQEVRVDINLSQELLLGGYDIVAVCSTVGGMEDGVAKELGDSPIADKELHSKIEGLARIVSVHGKAALAAHKT